MRSTILIIACMVAIVVSAPNTKGDNKQAEEASPFAQLTIAQRTCVMDHVKADPSILVSIFRHVQVWIYLNFLLEILCTTHN